MLGDVEAVECLVLHALVILKDTYYSDKHACNPQARATSSLFTDSTLTSSLYTPAPRSQVHPRIHTRIWITES
jgi:hypothetical protein